MLVRLPEDLLFEISKYLDMKDRIISLFSITLENPSYSNLKQFTRELNIELIGDFNYKKITDLKKSLHYNNNSLARRMLFL